MDDEKPESEATQARSMAADPAATSGSPEIPVDFESILPDYPVRVNDFDGPLDLLIHLIKKNEVDIYDIPIVLVTEQYLEYLDLMREIDLDVAGDFLVMAATLIQIKSRMLVPRIETAAEETEEEDPGEALVRRLLEHQQFKAAAEMLHDRETLRSAQWTRPDARVEEISGAPFERELEVDLFSLLQAFQAVLARRRGLPQVPLPEEIVPIEVRMREVLGRLSPDEPARFEDLFDDASSRRDLITTFLALLELIRLNLIRVLQAGPFGAMQLFRRDLAAGGPAPIIGAGAPTAKRSATIRGDKGDGR